MVPISAAQKVGRERAQQSYVAVSPQLEVAALVARIARRRPRRQLTVAAFTHVHHVITNAATHRWYQSESRCLGPCSDPAGGGSVGTGTRPPAESSLPALPCDCTPRNGKRTRSSPCLTTMRSGLTEYKTTPSAICWPSTNGTAGRSSTEIRAVLDAAVIITPLTANLNSLAAPCGAAFLSTAGATSIGDRRPEREGSLDFASGLAAGAGDGSTCGGEP